MSEPILVLAVTGFLAVAGTAILALLVIGIRRGDRGHLSRSPGSNSDAIAPRILVGVRYPGKSDKGEDQ
jgi:hypothetical protein